MSAVLNKTSILQAQTNTKIMIQVIIEQWEENKNKLEEYFRTTKQLREDWNHMIQHQ